VQAEAPVQTSQLALQTAQVFLVVSRKYPLLHLEQPLASQLAQPVPQATHPDAAKYAVEMQLGQAPVFGSQLAQRASHGRQPRLSEVG